MSEAKPYSFRFPADLREWFERRCPPGVSLTQMLVTVLEEYRDRQENPPAASTAVPLEAFQVIAQGNADVRGAVTAMLRFLIRERYEAEGADKVAEVVGAVMAEGKARTAEIDKDDAKVFQKLRGRG